MTDLDPLPPFPILMDDPAERWQWPALPFGWRHSAGPAHDEVQPCRIETPSGSSVDGFMRGFDPAAATLTFGSSATGAALTLPFARFRRLTLTTPLTSDERLPAAAHEHDYRFTAADGADVLSGQTIGHVDRDEGLYLFAPIDEDHSLLRMFVPRSTYQACAFGPTSRDTAAEHWVASPQQLLAAIERQQRTPVLPIGQSLLNLGLVTQKQLDRALTQPGDAPLGERLVDSGVISHADLQTAIGHKMGYPLVDLTRFPVDPAAAHKLPLNVALAHRALPIMIDGTRLIVAVDKPARVPALQALFALKGFAIVPVLASKGQILLALSSLPHSDGWSDNVSLRAGFLADTR
jgi:hypothetical protein